MTCISLTHSLHNILDMCHLPEIFHRRTLRDRGCGLCALYECPLSPSSPQELCVVFYPQPHPLGKSHHLIKSYVQIIKFGHQCKSLYALIFKLVI